jgi:hypothetical protein
LLEDVQFPEDMQVPEDLGRTVCPQHIRRKTIRAWRRGGNEPGVFCPAPRRLAH